jgi:hypothetical protein
MTSQVFKPKGPYGTPCKPVDVTPLDRCSICVPQRPLGRVWLSPAFPCLASSGRRAPSPTEETRGVGRRGWLAGIVTFRHDTARRLERRTILCFELHCCLPRMLGRAMQKVYPCLLCCCLLLRLLLIFPFHPRLHSPPVVLRDCSRLSKACDWFGHRGQWWCACNGGALVYPREANKKSRQSHLRQTLDTCTNLTQETW